jgi:anti-sigma regulatory factor (Ser/Thr protein kinase)
MNDALWGHRSPPPAGPRATTLGRWDPVTVADLTASRRFLAADLENGAGQAGTAQGAIERLLLAFEELGSNALRHGAPPVRMTVTAERTYWLLEVSDGAGDRPPVPAVDRDAALGGLGLHLVARICGAHGWTTDEGRKTAWARIDRTRAEAPADATC